MDPSERTRRRDFFFEDAGRAFDSGVKVGERHAAEGKSAAEAAREAVYAALHNLFVTFDHGTQLTDHVKVYVVDEDGKAH